MHVLWEAYGRIMKDIFLPCGNFYHSIRFADTTTYDFEFNSVVTEQDEESGIFRVTLFQGIGDISSLSTALTTQDSQFTYNFETKWLDGNNETLITSTIVEAQIVEVCNVEFDHANSQVVVEKVVLHCKSIIES